MNLNRTTVLSVLLGTLLLGACAQQSPPTLGGTPVGVTPVPLAPRTAVGQAITLTFSGLGTRDMTASVGAAGGVLGPLALTGQQSTVIPIRVLGRGSVDIIPAGQPRTSGYRYVYATVSVTSTAALSNVSFMAVRTTGTLPAAGNDTAISALFRAPGAPAYSTAEAGTLALSAQPTQASTVNPTTGQLQVLPNTTDTVQYLPESDLTFVPAGMKGLLPYGFTVLNTADRSRTLSTGTETNRMVIGMKLPLQANSQDDPYTFSFTAVPVSDSVTRVTQTLEGRLSGDSLQVRARAVALNASLTMLPGSPLNGFPLLDLRTAGEVLIPTGGLFTPVNVAAAGVNSTVIGRTEAVNVRFRTPPTGVPTGAVVVRGDQSAALPSTPTFTGDTLSIPARAGGYFPGEEVEVSLTAALRGAGLPQVFRFRTATSPASGTFGGTQNVPVGSNPYSVAVADVNGDGKLDLLSANNGNNTVSVRLGNGDGTFSGTQEVPVGSNPSSVAVGDVNGDGKLDLLSANGGSDTVSVRLGNGDGTFSGTQEVPVGSIPYSVAVGDVNGDGRLDLLTANSNSSTVSVRLNQP